MQRVNHSTGAADENLIVDDGGLGECRHVTVKSECPLQFQLADLIDAQSGGFDGLKPRIVSVRTPAIPDGLRFRGDGYALVRAIGARRKRNPATVGAKISSNGFALVTAHRIGDRHHHAKIQRAQNAACRHLAER